MADQFDPYHKWLGIPREQQPPNFYQLLGVGNFESDFEVLTNAVDRRIGHLRTFELGPHGQYATQLLKEVNQAKVTLLRPADKAIYDGKLHKQLAGQAPPPGPVGAPPSPTPAPAELELSIEDEADTDPHSYLGGGPELPRPAVRKATKAPQRSVGAIVYLSVICTAALCGIAGYFILRNMKEKETPQATGPTTPKRDPTPIVPKVDPQPRPMPVDPRPKVDPLPPAVDPVTPQPPDPNSEPPVDLIALVDPKAPGFTGMWTLAGNQLTSTAGRRAPLAIPYTPPPEYDLNLTVKKIQGDGVLCLCLMAGAKQFQVILDERGVSRLPASQTSAAAGDKWQHEGTLLPTGRDVPIKCQVRKERVLIQVNGQQVFAWNDPLRYLRIMPDYKPPRGQSIYLLPTGSFQFSQIEMVRIRDLSTPIARVEPMPDPMPGDPPDKPEPVKPVKKTAPPDAETLKATVAQIQEVFKEEIKEAKKPEERHKIAQTIFKKGVETTDDNVSRYAALWLAKDMAARVGDWVAVIEAVNELDRHYEIKPIELKLTSLGIANEPASAGIATNAVDLLIPLIDECVAADDYALAERVVMSAQSAARKAKDAELTKRVQARGAEVRALKTHFATIAADLATLEKQPAEPTANLSVGRWYCFAKGQWDKGLPLLAQGDDKALAELAARELAMAASADDQAALADSWWAIAEAEPQAVLKNHLQLHAADWYKKALAGLEGLNRAKAEKRIADIAKLSEGLSSYIKLVNLAPAEPPKAFKDAIAVNRITVFNEAKPPRGVGGQDVCTEYLWAHAPSRIVYNIPAGVREFRATGYCLQSKSVAFRVVVDGRELHRSETAGIAPIRIDLPTDGKRIELIVDDKGSYNSDHSFWCFPRFYR